MNIRRIDRSPEGLARTAKIKSLLPKVSFIDSILNPALDSLEPVLLTMLYAELEIYREYPKRPFQDPSSALKELDTFDARNHTTCFQGKAFEVMDNSLGDAELMDYRKAIGTLNHSEWGDATLLEVWGADHMADFPEMVREAFKYGTGITDTKPELTFHINPLFKNKLSGVTLMSDDQKIAKYDEDLLIAKALHFGARTLAECNREEDRYMSLSDEERRDEENEYLRIRKDVIGI